MAIDFPATPTPGQEFQGYYWDNTKQAWRSQSTNRGSVITSATTPTGATAGDLWFNTVDGTMYVYYDDGITTQWVEIQANVDNYKTPSYNYLINGGFDIWQRGTSIAVADFARAYTTDCWLIPGSSAGLTVSRISSGLPKTSQYGARITKTSATAGAFQFAHHVELSNFKPLHGNVATLSIKLRRNSTLTSNIELLIAANPSEDYAYRGTGWYDLANVTIPNNVIPTGTDSSSWYTATLTTTIPAANTIGSLAVAVRTLSQAETNGYLEVCEAQLEQSTIATPFRRNQPNIQAELASCQRYYEKSYEINTAPGTSTLVDAIQFTPSRTSSNTRVEGLTFKVTKRVPPTIVLYSTTGASGAVRDLTNGADRTGAVARVAEIGTNRANTIDTSANLNDAAVHGFHFTASAEL